MILPRSCKAPLAAAYTLVAGQFGTNMTTLNFDGKSLSVASVIQMPTNPDWIEPAGPKSNGTFYTLSDDKLLMSYKLDGKGGAQQTGKVSIPGEGPVHIQYGGDYVAVANYGSGSVVHVPVGADGVVANNAPTQELQLPFGYAKAPGPIPDRETQSRAHGSFQTDDGTMWVADLGSDSVWSWTLEGGKMTLGEEYKVPPGFGPRHLASPDGKAVYVIGEMANAVIALQKGTVATDPVSILPVDLPEGYGELMGGGEIVSHPTVRTTMSASNRNQVAITAKHPDYKAPAGDEVAILSAATPGKPAKVIARIPTKCDHIRGMKVSPDGEFVAVGGMNNKMIEIYKISGAQKEVWTLVASTNEVAQVADIAFFPKA